MKTIFFILCCCLSAMCSRGQYSVQISRADCRDTNESVSPWKDTMLLYRESGGWIKGKVLVFKDNKVVIADSLEPGSYHLVYTNLFEQRRDKRITIGGEKRLQVRVCTDSAATYEQEMLTMLDEGEQLTLKVERSSCSGYWIKKITINRVKGNYIARLYQEVWSETYDRKQKKWKGQYRPGPLLKKVTLTAKQIDDFTRFENELRVVGTDYCTTSYQYTLSSTNRLHAIHRVDGGCAWYGYDFLEASLFGTEESGNE